MCPTGLKMFGFSSTVCYFSFRNLVECTLILQGSSEILKEEEMRLILDSTFKDTEV
jgi:hypothetical protein